MPEHQASGASPLLAQLLYNRGLTDPSQFEPFLAADERLAADPNLLPDMHQAVARIYRALLSNEKIAVYGDFDADGITATAVLVQGLAMLGCQAVPYIPHRLTEGYGLRTVALENLKKQGVSLVVTVDCGVTALAEIAKAKKLGLDIIVTDHHIPGDKLPIAKVVVNPKLPGSKYPFTELAGVGVALKLLQALFRGMGREQELDRVVDLVALGTVADMVPLLGENRYLVKRGLEMMRNSPRLGIREILTQSSSKLVLSGAEGASQIDAESISWVIAPRLNAAGRLEHAMGSYRLLTTDSPKEARELATWLEEKNAERQKLTATVLEKAREQAMTQLDSPLLIAGDPEFPAGIIGLVAGRLAQEFYRPAIVLRTGEQLCGGSCRSIPEFDITRALNKCQHLLTNFGGHAGAAGLSVKTKDLPRLKEMLLEIAARELAGVDLRPRLDIDAEVNLAEMGKETFSIIQRLAPFGQGNPVPVFLSRRVNVVECRTMGATGDHLRLRVRQTATSTAHSPDSHTPSAMRHAPSATWDAVGFGLGRYHVEMTRSTGSGQASLIDIVYSLELDRWNGQENLRLNILDFGAGERLK